MEEGTRENWGREKKKKKEGRDEFVKKFANGEGMFGRK